MRYAAAIVLLLAACSQLPAAEQQPDPSRGRVVEETTTVVREIVVENAEDAPKGLNAVMQGVGAASTDGGTMERDLAAEQQSETLTWAGIACIAAGIGLLIARFGFGMPIVPVGVSLGIAGTGVVLLFLPTIIDRYAWVMFVAIAGVAAVSLGPALIDNYRKLKAQIAQPEQPSA